MTLYAQLAAILPDTHVVGDIIVATAIAVSKYFDHTKGKRRDRRANASFDELVRDIKGVQTDVQNLHIEIAELRGELKGRGGIGQ